MFPEEGRAAAATHLTNKEAPSPPSDAKANGIPARRAHDELSRPEVQEDIRPAEDPVSVGKKGEGQQDGEKKKQRAKNAMDITGE